VKLLTDVVEAHRHMQRQINTDFVDTGTSWPTALSKLLTSLGNMMRGHITDSISLVSILNDVYLNHVDYLVTGLSTQLQECNSQIAEAHVIIKRAQSPSAKISSHQTDRVQLLRNKLRYLYRTLYDFESTLNAEAGDSSHHWHYFPNPLRIGECSLMFRTVRDSLKDLAPRLSINSSVLSSSVNAAVFANMTKLRSNMTYTSTCIMSYEKKLLSFEDELNSIMKSTLKADFNYDPSTTSLLQFNMDSQWLDSITMQYIASSESKLDIATALHTNGSEVLTHADRLHGDIELSLFSKVSDVIDYSETGMVSFYSDLLQRVTSLQRYMFPNDTSLEDFMRSLSIWRMPIVNFQKSQVITHVYYS